MKVKKAEVEAIRQPKKEKQESCVCLFRQNSA